MARNNASAQHLRHEIKGLAGGQQVLIRSNATRLIEGHGINSPSLNDRMVLRNDFNSGHFTAESIRSWSFKIRFASRGFL
jgi:hypothetical protein